MTVPEEGSLPPRTEANLVEAARINTEIGLDYMRKGQFEAADAMGLNYPQKTLLIILPQALRVVIPPLFGTPRSANFLPPLAMM